MPVKQLRELGKGTKVEKDESLIDGGKSPMMTMKPQPLADRSRLELERPGCQR